MVLATLPLTADTTGVKEPGTAGRGLAVAIGGFPSDSLEVRTSDSVIKYRKHFDDALAAIAWLTAWTEENDG